MIITHFCISSMVYACSYFLLVSYCLLHQSFSIPPPIVRVGLFGEKITSTGVINYAGTQNIAAMLMAIKEINNKTDGIYDDLLPSTLIQISLRETHSDFHRASLAAQDFSREVFGGKGVIGAIGTGYDTSSKAAAQTFSFIDFKINMIDYFANDSTLSHSSNFPYYARVVPSRGFGGRMVMDFVKYYGWKTLSVFSTLDTYGTDCMSEFVDASIKYGISIENKVSFWPGTTDFTEILRGVMSSGILKVFVLIMAPPDAGHLMEAGYNAGLFREGTQIIGSQFIVKPACWQSMSPDAPVKDIMKGVTGIVPVLVDIRRPAYQDFVRRYLEQPDTSVTAVDGAVTCSAQKDDDGGTYLFRSDSGVCAGVEFSKTKPADLVDSVGYAYDAVVTMAIALDYVIYKEKLGQSFTGDDIRSALFKAIDFNGVTGHITFFEGLGGKEGYGAGDRQSGLRYKAQSFNPNLYEKDQSNPLAPIRNIGVYIKDEEMFEPCDPIEDSTCDDPVFNTASGGVVDGSPDVIEIGLQDWARTLLRVGGSLGLITVAWYLFVVVLYMDTRLIKVSQPGILLLVLFGGTLASILVLLHSADVSDQSCMTTMWFGHLAYALAFTALICKTWRVGCIVNSGFSKVKVTVNAMRLRLALIVLFFCLVLVVDSVVGRPHRGYEESFNGRHLIRLMKCETDNPNVSRALFVMEGMLLIYGAKLCWGAMHAPSSVGDAGVVSLAIYLVVFVCAVTFPIVFLSIDPTPQNLTVVMCVGFVVSVVGVINIVLLPKLLLVLDGADLDNNLEIVRSVSPDSESRRRSSVVLLRLSEKIRSRAGIVSVARTARDASERNPVSPGGIGTPATPKGGQPRFSLLAKATAVPVPQSPSPRLFETKFNNQIDEPSRSHESDKKDEGDIEVESFVG